MENRSHPTDPHSNVSKFSGYDPDKYTLSNVSLTVLTDESLTPGRPPCLTQRTVGKFLQPLTRELTEVPPRPTIDELPDAVIDQMVQKDKAFWVDKPGANAYTLHDAYYKYGMTTEMVKPPHQDVFPRSYQYDLDCVRYRRLHACDSIKEAQGSDKVRLLINLTYWLANRTCVFKLHNEWKTQGTAQGIKVRYLESKPQCRDCNKMEVPGLTPFQLAWTKDPGAKQRWRYYPDLTAGLTSKEIHKLMAEVGRPFYNEACNWYYKNYPPVKYNCIMRKFSK